MRVPWTARRSNQSILKEISPEYSLEGLMLKLDESQTEIKIARRNVYNFRYADDTTFMAESEKELKSLLMKVKEESEKAG